MLRRNIPTFSHRRSLFFVSASTSSANQLCRPFPAVGSTLFQSQRGVQFRKTSEMFNAVNGKKEDRQKWVTKSTADYAERLKIAAAAGIKTSAKPFVSTLLYESEGKTSAKTTISPTDLHQKQQHEESGKVSTTSGDKGAKRTATEEDPRIAQHREEFEKSTYEHWHRIKTFDAARAGRFKTYFAEHGWGFFTFYCLIWLTSFAAIYLILKLKILDYRGMFEYIYCITFGQIERDSFFAKMEDVNPMYFDLAFTFALNEVVDIVRLPLAVLWFMALRHWWTRRPEKTMMRDMSPEKAIEFTIKARDSLRKGMMRGSGTTLSRAARSPNPEVPRDR